MAKHLSVRQIESYWSEGCLFPVTLMDAAEAAEHRRRLEAAETEHGNFHYRVKPYLLLTTAAVLGRHPALLDAVEEVLGPDILLWDSAYIIKEPCDTRYVSWHQDLTYWGLDSDAMVTAWIALTSSTPDNGGMKFIPGSHKGGKRQHRDTRAGDNILHRGQEIADVDEGRAVDIVLEPGQASLHHGWVLHASAPNPSGGRRIGLSLQYVAPSVRQVFDAEESATLVRGVDRFGHFRPEPICARDFAPEAVAFQQQAERRKHAVYDTA